MSSLKQISPSINRLIGNLKRRIRRYVLLEGLACFLIWAVLLFWLSLAIDYLPVKFGYSELSKPFRVILLILSGLITGYVVVRMIGQRIFVRMKDSSMALLIEQKYPEFQDSLLTTVNRSAADRVDVHADEAMLERTRQEAEALVPNVDLSTVLNYRPLKRNVALAGVAVGAVVLMGVFNWPALSTATERLYLLRDKPWPRTCRIEMVGIKVKRENPVEGIVELGTILEPKAGEFRISKGATLTLMVRAEAGEDDDRRLPSSCTLIYDSADGDRGVQTFKKIGAPRDGFQLYSLDGPPFQGVLTDLNFSVRGGDYRLGPFSLNVVDEPSVTETVVACQFPDYMVDESSMRWTDRIIPWTGNMLLPQGTNLKIQAKSNKPLERVYARSSVSGETKALELDSNQFELPIDALTEAVEFQFYLCDQDGIVSEQPHSVSFEPIEDQAPIVQTRLKGIGTAVTPDVQISFNGSVEDDYGVEKTWLEIDVAEAETLTEPVETGVDGRLATIIDFKQRRQERGDAYQLPVAEGSTVALVVKSEDRFNLRANPNLGVGDRYVLDVVSPNELVRMLERLEVGQRRRLEQIYLEMVDARNYLVRTKSNLDAPGEQLVEPGESSSIEETDDEDELRNQELRLLFSQRAILQIDKSTNEILGCAEAFDNIRLQLINNRIDSEDRKKRFSEQIIAPLKLIGGESMQQLRDKVVELEARLTELQQFPNDSGLSGQADQVATVSIERADIALAQLDEVLNALIKYETQNELLEIVREMIKNQQQLMERTKKERQKKAFEGLLDLE